MNRPTEPLRVFVSYASEDDEHRIRFQAALRQLEKEGLVDLWADRKILPGEDWADRIDEELETADIVVPLVSIPFLNSDYCDIEIGRALERRERGEVIVVPVLIKSAPLGRHPLTRIQVLPDGQKPV